MRRWAAGGRCFPIIWVALAALPQAALAIDIRFDYRYDTSGLFAAPEPRAALDFAAQTFEVFTDRLSPISSASGSWTAQFSHPGAATIVNLPGLDIAADEVLIFVGAYDLEGTALARGTVGAFSSATDPVLLDALQTRGQSNAWGSAPTDFGRWGGSITFDTKREGETTPRAWHFDPFTPPASNTMDLVSVALHEIAHVLGFSVATNPLKPLSLEAYLDRANSLFVGPQAQAEYGGPVPMEASGHHWGKSIKSEYDGNLQTAVMSPNIYAGIRRGFTRLDYAAMADIGWEVPREMLSDPVAQLPGDYNGDTAVSLRDYGSWRESFGSISLQADGNRDRQVNVADYVLWRDSFDRSTVAVGDFDFNDVVDGADYGVWSRSFGSTVNSAADGNSSGRVDIADYVLWRDALHRDLPLVGDFDLNRSVDAQDYNLWSRSFGSTNNLAADANSSGRVDITDYVLWRNHLGQGAVSTAAEVNAVPEPSLVGLTMAVLLAGLATARRR